MSASYERMNYLTSFGFSIRWRRQSLDFFEKNDDQVKILDLMCGMGEMWSMINKKFPNAEIDALDFSDEMIKKAQQKNNEKWYGKINLLKQNVLENNLKTAHYDFVFCGYGLKTFNETQTENLAKEIKRVLKSDGKFSFVEVSVPQSFFLKSIYKVYLKNFVPILGKLFLGNPEQYRMLWKYTNAYKNAEKTFRIFEKEQLSTTYHSYFFGCASGIYGTKTP